MFPVAIYTLGCKLNQLESEALAGAFRDAGFCLMPWGTLLEGPGIIVISTCTVTSKADQKCRRTIRKALRDNPEACVVVAGCYAELDAAEIESLAAESAESGCGRATGGRRLFVVGGGGDGAGNAKSALLLLPGYLREAMSDSGAVGGGTLPAGNSLPQILETWERSGKPSGTFSFRPDSFTFHSRGYLKIQDGCNSACSYCRVRLARGPSVSLEREAVLEGLLAFEAAGCPELMITGANISQYNHGGGLAGLLEYLLEGSRSIALRLSSLEPEGIDERLVRALAHPRIRPHFHLTVQSGSDDVLKKMGRVYNARKVEEGAALLRGVKGDPFLACDIIAGFPGETEDDFAHTLELCETIGFAWIHAFPFSRRPGTAAWYFEGKVCEREVTRRVQALASLALRGRRAYAQNCLGKELSAVVEKGKAGHGQCRAVSENYLKLIVNCPGAEPAPGTVLRCVPVTLCDNVNGESPDAVAEMK